MTDQTPILRVQDLGKSFTLHTQGGVAIPVFSGLSLDVRAGECVALHGPSGCGKSTLMRALYANYKPTQGRVEVLHDGARVDMVSAAPRTIVEVRRRTLGYVSQFLRVIPRVATLDIVAEPLRAWGTPAEEARAVAAGLLTRLRIPERLWSLAPATFSGGEQQRVNIARGFCAPYPVLLLDEPTASLDHANRDTVLELIEDAKDRGAAIVGIFHDAPARERVCDRLFEIEAFRSAA